MSYDKDLYNKSKNIIDKKVVVSMFLDIERAFYNTSTQVTIDELKGCKVDKRLVKTRLRFYSIPF